MAKKSGLGKGLDSLISSDYKVKPRKTATSKENTAEKVENKPEVEKKAKLSTQSGQIVDNVDKNVGKHNDLTLQDSRMIKTKDIEPNRDQPRTNFDEEALAELTESIRQYGVLQPLLVTPKGKRFEIIAGERRWRAAKAAGLKEIPAIVREYTEKEIMEISLIENIQREDLNVIEEAKAYQKLIQEFQYRQEDLAEKISRSRSAITNRLRLLKLAEEVQQMLVSGEISEGHARTLLSLEDASQQIAAAKRIVVEKLSVRETEKLVKKMLSPAPEKKEDWKQIDQIIYDQWEEELKASMGTKVTIQRKKKDKGQINIDYYSIDELERILEILKRQ